MRRFILSMPDDLAERVEAYRVGAGLKSTAEAHRALLCAGLAEPVLAVKAIPLAPTWPSGAVLLPEHVSDPGADAKLRIVRPKPGSLLKKR